MKFSKWILGAALLFSAQVTSVQAAGSCDPCDPCYDSNPCDLCDIDWCDVEFDFYIDALYWEVCKGDHNVAENNDGKEKYLDTCYDWGWRLGAVARWKCWDLGLRFAKYCTDASTKIPENATEVDDGKAKFDFDYRVFDIELGYTCCLPCCSISLRPIAGVKMAWIDDDYDKSDIFFSSNSKVDFCGYGLYIGTSARWELCSYCACDRDIPIALVARASTALLRGEFEQDVETNAPGGGDIGCECLYVPVHELYVGLDFSFCDLCGCGDAFFQIGYETQYWGWREYNQSEDITHLGLGGMVMRFGFGF